MTTTESAPITDDHNWALTSVFVAVGTGLDNYGCEECDPDDYNQYSVGEYGDRHEGDAWTSLTISAENDDRQPGESDEASVTVYIVLDGTPDAERLARAAAVTRQR